MADRFAPPPDPRPLDPPWPAMVWPVPTGTELSGYSIALSTLDPEADAPALFDALDDDQVWAHLAGRPRDPEQLAALLRQRRDLGWQQWLVRDLRARGSPVVGTSTYLEVDAGDARLEVGATAYSPVVWATHVNPATKLLLLGYAFDDLGVGRVQLKTDIRNIRSQQAIARLGATYEGVLRRYQRRADGSIRDTVLFSITAEDWPGVRAGLQRRCR